MIAGVKNVIAANRLKIILLRVWKEFCVSPREGRMNEYIRRQNAGNKPTRTASRFIIKFEVNCRDINENMILNVDALPNAVNGMLIAGLIFGIRALNFRYS